VVQRIVSVMDIRSVSMETKLGPTSNADLKENPNDAFVLLCKVN